jgi:hypothetical protein
MKDGRNSLEPPKTPDLISSNVLSWSPKLKLSVARSAIKAAVESGIISPCLFLEFSFGTP